MLGATDCGGSQVAEVMAASARIKSGGYDSWYDAWNETADAVAGEAAKQASRGHRVSARDAFPRASNYCRNSEFCLHANPADPRIARAYRCANRGVAFARIYDWLGETLA